MLKIGIAACFFHEDPQRAIFKGMTLQYIEQNVAHWLMQRDVLAFMVPSPDGATRRASSGVTVNDYARELDALVLMGGSDVCPESYGEVALKPAWNGDRVRGRAPPRPHRAGHHLGHGPELEGRPHAAQLRLQSVDASSTGGHAGCDEVYLTAQGWSCALVSWAS
jgi:hypothetical protein